MQHIVEERYVDVVSGKQGIFELTKHRAYVGEARFTRPT